MVQIWGGNVIPHMTEDTTSPLSAEVKYCEDDKKVNNGIYTRYYLVCIGIGEFHAQAESLPH